jgi:hypothetical protein
MYGNAAHVEPDHQIVFLMMEVALGDAKGERLAVPLDKVSFHEASRLPKGEDAEDKVVVTVMGVHSHCVVRSRMATGTWDEALQYIAHKCLSISALSCASPADAKPDVPTDE